MHPFKGFLRGTSVNARGALCVTVFVCSDVDVPYSGWNVVSQGEGDLECMGYSNK